jgi:transcriptional regulator with XRE-family HTH domain
LTKLKNKEYRDAFVSEHIDTGIPFQIRALRKQRKLNQKKFENKYGIQQALISRWENPNYSGFTLSTLKKIASLLDIGLIVRFVPISDLVEWELNLNTESLRALSFKDDPYFKEQEKETTVTSDTEQQTIMHPSEALAPVVNIKEYIAKTKPSTTQNTNTVSMAACV